MRISSSLVTLTVVISASAVAAQDSLTTTTLTSTTTRTRTLTQCDPTFTECPVRTSSSLSTDETSSSSPIWSIANTTVPISPTAIATTSSSVITSLTSATTTTSSTVATDVPTDVPTAAAPRTRTSGNGLVVAALVAAIRMII